MKSPVSLDQNVRDESGVNRQGSMLHRADVILGGHAPWRN